jgi:Tfp pilus assembly protein PilX
VKDELSHKGSTLVVVLTLVVVFSMIAIGLADLIDAQSREVEFMLAQSKVDYVAHSGLIHAETEVTEDVAITVQNPVSFDYIGEYCAAWITRNGRQVCNSQAEPANPCCERSGGICKRLSVQGVCKERGKWDAVYSARYESSSDSIVSSGCIVFIEDRLKLDNCQPAIDLGSCDTILENKTRIENCMGTSGLTVFQKTQVMILDWE